MSAFHAALVHDMGTFFNPDEFGERHYLDGRECRCVIETDETADGGVEQIDVIANRRTVYVSEKEFGRPPLPDSQLSIDDSLHVVRSAAVEMGVIVIKVEEFS